MCPNLGGNSYIGGERDTGSGGSRRASPNRGGPTDTARNGAEDAAGKFAAQGVSTFQTVPSTGAGERALAGQVVVVIQHPGHQRPGSSPQLVEEGALSKPGHRNCLVEALFQVDVKRASEFRFGGEHEGWVTLRDAMSSLPKFSSEDPTRSVEA